MDTRLRELRGDKSQREFAKELGISQRAYSYYESGKQELKSGMIRQICDQYGVTMEWLLGFSTPTYERLTEDELELVRLYRKCDYERQQRTLNDLRDRALITGEVQKSAEEEPEIAAKRYA